MTLHEMFEQYRQVFHSNGHHADSSHRKSSLQELNNNSACFNNKNVACSGGQELPLNVENKNVKWNKLVNNKSMNNEENAEHQSEQIV
jgi:hypothetical protein